MHILHIITGLAPDGAQHSLLRLVVGMRSRGVESSVLCLAGKAVIGDRLEREGVRVTYLDMQNLVLLPFKLRKLVREVNLSKADVVQTWMYHADLVGGLAARLARKPLVWGIRRTSIDSGDTKLSTRLIGRCCAWLSRSWPRYIVCCASAAAREHAAFGYDGARMRVIQNGFDSEAIQFNSDAGSELRRELGLRGATLLVGFVGRYHQSKGIGNFLAAAKAVSESGGHDIAFILCGRGIVPENPEVSALLLSHPIASDVRMLGHRKDVHDVMSALDVFVLSSITEGFPNVLAEAMLCETCCVATDVGDAAEILGDAGIIVPSGDVKALANGLRAVLGYSPTKRRQISCAARDRVRGNYSVERMVSEYYQTYCKVLEER